MTPQHCLPDESLERRRNFPHLSYTCVRCFTAQDGTTSVPILASRCVLTAAVPRHTLRETPYSSSSQAQRKRFGMAPLSALWLPIVLSAVIVFVASSIMHMLLPYHKGD